MLRALIVACLLSLLASTAEARGRLLGRRGGGDCDSGSSSQGCNISGQTDEAEVADVIRVVAPTPQVALAPSPRPALEDSAKLRRKHRPILDREKCRAFCAVESNPVQVLPTVTTERFVSR